MAIAADILRFRSRFPEFDNGDVSDPQIAAVLDSAGLSVERASWLAGDFNEALMLLAAHKLSLSLTQAATASSTGTGDSSLFIRSIGFGERRVMFGERKAGKSSSTTGLGAGEDLLNETTYGQEYLSLRSRNIVPVAII